MIGNARIICGIDLGADTESIVSFAGYFALKTSSRLTLFYVIDYLLTPPAYLSKYIDQEKKKDEAKIAKWSALLSSRGINSDFSIALGRLHESFLREINEAAADLLVIGYKSHLIRPSSSERLIKSIPAPMLVVKGKGAEGATLDTISIKKILCPVDFSENSRKAALAAKRYADLFSAELSLVHIIPSHLLRGKFAEWKNMDENRCGEFEEGMHREATSKLHALNAELGIGDIEVCHGKPSERICKIADENRCDMIVIGARGLSYIRSILIGSTTEEVLRSSGCPVMVIH